MVVKIVIGWLLLDLIIVALLTRKAYRKENGFCNGCMYNERRLAGGISKELCENSGCYKKGEEI